MSAGSEKIHFVCVRAAHHRRWATGDLCEHLGLAAYCPAGDVADHDWMPTATDRSGLVLLGYTRTRVETDVGSGDEREPRDEDVPLLIRT